MFDVYTINEATATQYQRGTYATLEEAQARADAELGPRTRKSLRVVVLNRIGKVAYETRGNS